MNAIDVTITGFDGIETSGNRQVCPVATTVYRVTAIGVAGASSSTVRVHVKPQGQIETGLPVTARISRLVPYRNGQNGTLETARDARAPQSQSPAGPPVLRPTLPSQTRRHSEPEPPNKISDGTDGMMQTYLEALVAANDGPGLTSVLFPELLHESRPETLRQYARLAIQVNETSTARRAFERLLDVSKDDAESLRWLGIHLFQQGEYTRSRDYLDGAHRLGKGDYLSHFYHGELLMRLGGSELAEAHFSKALVEVVSTAPLTVAMLRVQALLLDRLGRSDESFALFEELLEEHPKDKHLRADYVAVLIDRGKLTKAQKVLAMPEYR